MAPKNKISYSVRPDKPCEVDYERLIVAIQTVIKSHLGETPTVAVAYRLPDDKTVSWAANIPWPEGVRLIRGAVSNMRISGLTGARRPYDHTKRGARY
jgi:hypothetical protein